MFALALQHDMMLESVSIKLREVEYYMQITINTSPKKTDIASTILWGYHRSNMTGWNADNAVLVVKKSPPVDQASNCSNIKVGNTQ